MKRYVIEVTLLVYPKDVVDFAASERVHHPSNVKKRYLFSDQQLADFNDLVDSVCSVIDHFGFDIVDEGQSKKSYSYYVSFFPTDQYGNRWDDTVEIKFRLANHLNYGSTNQISDRFNKGKSIENYSAEQPMVYVKSFLLGSKQYPGQFAIMQAVKKICINLKAGDYSVLDN